MDKYAINGTLTLDGYERKGILVLTDDLKGLVELMTLKGSLIWHHKEVHYMYTKEFKELITKSKLVKI